MPQQHNVRCKPGFGGRLWCCAMLILLPGCPSSEPNAPPATTSSLAAQPPIPRVLQLHIPGDDLDTLDFLDVRGCAVQATIIKRSSSLGRHAKPSQRLLLELEYLKLAPPCITLLRDRNNQATADRLAHAWQRRWEQLPTLVFNATLGSEEYSAFWIAATGPGGYLPVDHDVTLSALHAINEHLRRWQKHDFDMQNREFELLLSEVAGGNGAALRATGPSDALLQAIIDLEALLTPILPRSYRRWVADRNLHHAPTSGPAPAYTAALSNAVPKSP
jgi:hypothetical protein